jgi:CO/xanthine dehydrogenase FAD-binding subunit
MEFWQPTSWAEALEMRQRGAEPVAGGTDLMVDLNFDRRRPSSLLDLGRLPELREWGHIDGWLRLGAGLTYTRVIAELGGLSPGLALAARSVGSPQIRNRGTLGGNLATASPAGDALPPLLAAGAEVELVSRGGTRRLPLTAFLLGPKRCALAADELVAAVWVPPARGPQQFAKVGPRNAMVIAVCSVALDLDPERRRVGCAIGSAGPTVLRATDAERFLEEVLDEEDWKALPVAAQSRFGALVAAAARPIDDVRGTAAYRRHAISVLASRCLARAWADRRWA